ncbi:hypothetical protein HTK96_08520 [Brevundimonas vesicularis]|uniref:STN domain-containing protein n=1 Tax=Brevundimonas vesicularis TaxID=41276 RepID=UPI001574491F|nr:STN domain-containing protein [Brevundimonas vesicularis]NSX33412.1 hypothetical protein [Brevundimonas vesicularis]
MGQEFTSTALAALMLGVATPVIAQSTEAVRTFSIGAGPLERSLPVFAQQSGLQILYPSALVTGRQARALTGDYTPEAALGELHIADYGLQRTPLMRFLFRQVQALDGRENTQPSAEGVLQGLMAEVGFEGVEECKVIPTPSGSISLYRARKPLARPIAARP